MPDNQTTGLCRLTVHAPGRSIDLAVPADVPVADLLPAVLGFGGAGLGETGIDHGGWVLQRLGGAPLDEERTLDSYDLRDGETVYLRPQIDALPEAHLDDLVDGISTTMRGRPNSWTPEVSRNLLRGVAVALLALGLLVIALPGGAGWLRTLCAAGCGLLLLAGAASASHAVGDAGASAALGCMVSPYLALAGWLLPGGSLTGPHGPETLGFRLLAACAAGAGGAIMALAAVGTFAALFLALAVIATLGALAGALMAVAGLPPHHVAGIIAPVAVVLGAFVPSLAFRLSGLRMPPLPSNTQQLQEGITPHPTAVVAARAVLADGWMSALYGAVGVTCSVCLVLLARQDRLAEAVMVIVLSLLLVLHGGGLGNMWQRLFLVVPGIAGALLLIFSQAAGASVAGRMLVAFALLAATGTAAITSWTVPGKRLVPYWGRAGEILHSAAAIGLLPVAFWVGGAYGALRGLNA